jgi:sulfopyruvate decarboxylase subunit beta
MKRIEALEAILPAIEAVPVVVTCAATTRELAAISDRPNYFYLLDSMGLAVSVATGLALALDNEPIERVVAIEGDGSLLMNLNALATLGFLAPEKIIVVLLDNGVYGSTADVPTYTGKLDLAEMARSVGAVVSVASDRTGVVDALDSAFAAPGPHFLHIRIEPGNASCPLFLPDPVALKVRFETWLRERLAG